MSIAFVCHPKQFCTSRLKQSPCTLYMCIHLNYDTFKMVYPVLAMPTNSIQTNQLNALILQNTNLHKITASHECVFDT